MSGKPPKSDNTPMTVNATVSALAREGDAAAMARMKLHVARRKLNVVQIAKTTADGAVLANCEEREGR